jgi:hypothetical protein
VSCPDEVVLWFDRGLCSGTVGQMPAGGVALTGPHDFAVWPHWSSRGYRLGGRLRPPHSMLATTRCHETGLSRYAVGSPGASRIRSTIAVSRGSRAARVRRAASRTSAASAGRSSSCNTRMRRCAATRTNWGCASSPAACSLDAHPSSAWSAGAPPLASARRLSAAAGGSPFTSCASRSQILSCSGVTPVVRSGPCESFLRPGSWASKERSREAQQAYAGADHS